MAQNTFTIVQNVINSIYDGTLIPGMDLTETVDYIARATPTPSTYNPATGSILILAATTPIKAVITDFTTHEIEGSGGQLVYGDLKAFIQPTTSITFVTVGDAITWRGETYEVHSILEENRIEETDLTWVLQLRK